MECDHCNVSASKYLKEDIGLQKLIDLIHEVKDTEITTISFAGGEPFARPTLLMTALEECTSLGINSKVVTSAFFGTSPSHSIKFLSKFKDAGLQEIIFSYDDPHAAYLKEHIVVNAVNAAMELDMTVTIQVAVEPDSIIDKKYVRNLLNKSCKGAESVVISQALINSTGRAEDTADAERKALRRNDHRVYRGPCKFCNQTNYG